MDENAKNPEQTPSTGQAGVTPEQAPEAQAPSTGQSVVAPGQTPAAQTSPASQSAATPEQAPSATPEQASKAEQPGAVPGQPVPTPEPMPPAGQPVATPAGGSTAPIPPAAPPAKPVSATPALVCGILAILFCAIPIVGIILGIIAIVLAGNYFKAGGTEGTGKAGRICGIIGIVLSVVMIIVSAVAVFFTLQALDNPRSASVAITEEYATSSAAPAASGEMEERETVNDVVSQRLDQIKNADPAMMASLEAIATESYADVFASNGLGMTMENCGIDPAAYVSLMVTDFDYSFSDATVRAGDGSATAEADYYLTMKNILDVIDLFNDELDTANATGAFDGLSDDEIRAEWGRLFMSAVEQADVSDQNYLEVELTKVNGEWVIDEDEWTDEMEYFFGLD